MALARRRPFGLYRWLANAPRWFYSPEETTQVILALFHLHSREVRFAGPFLGIDPDAPEPVLRARIQAFFRGVRLRPAEEPET